MRRPHPRDSREGLRRHSRKSGNPDSAHAPSLPLVWGCIVALVACVLWGGSGTEAHAQRLGEASPETLKRILKDHLHFREAGKPLPLLKVEIPPAVKPRTLVDGRTTLPRQIRRQIARSSIISILYYDGERIRYDWRRDDVPEDASLWGHSMAKGIASWLFGKAYCGGRIDSLGDRIKKYVPKLDNSFYGDASISDALDMSSGDEVLYPHPKYRRSIRSRLDRGKPIIDTLLSLGNPRPGEKEFYYSNVPANAIGAVLFSVTPEGLEEFASEAMADDAGLRYPSLFLADWEGVPHAANRFYAHRMDWLRLGMRIAEQFKAEGCIGDYLRSAVAEAIPTSLPYRVKYGKFFWSSRPSVRFNDVWMMGSGCPSVVMDVDHGRVLAVHAIRCDYAATEIVNAAFERR